MKRRDQHAMEAMPDWRAEYDRALIERDNLASTLKMVVTLLQKHDDPDGLCNYCYTHLVAHIKYMLDNNS